MSKPTHLTFSNTQFARVGGVPVSLKGGQDVLQTAVPTNWFPVNLPAATDGTPTAMDCLTLLNTLRPLVARLTIQQSVALALAYRTVQSGIAPGGSFVVNGVTTAGAFLFDGGFKIGESVPVDVVNKNPALGFDLAMRLARMAASRIDFELFRLFGSATGTSSGTQGTAPTEANLATSLATIPVTGEPAFALFNPTIVAQMETAGSLPFGAYSALINGQSPIGLLAADTTTPSAGTRQTRILASDFVATTGGGPTYHNMLVLPSFWAFATADAGTVLGNTTPAPTFLTGVTQVTTSVALDPEYATPQLALQLVISNTGAGNQTVYVNAQYAAMAINPANAAVILA